MAKSLSRFPPTSFLRVPFLMKDNQRRERGLYLDPFSTSRLVNGTLKLRYRSHCLYLTCQSATPVLHSACLPDLRLTVFEFLIRVSKPQFRPSLFTHPRCVTSDHHELHWSNSVSAYPLPRERRFRTSMGL
jgi:hypothetical protein